jgi:hypothetical protein
MDKLLSNKKHINSFKQYKNCMKLYEISIILTPNSDKTNTGENYRSEKSEHEYKFSMNY